jgi:hypothetical protein
MWDATEVVARAPKKIVVKTTTSTRLKMGSNVIIYIMLLSNSIYGHVIQNFDGGESWNGF